LNDILTPAECQELTFIHKALAAAGYSPHLWTTKLGDVAYSAPPLLLPLVAARDKVTAAAEAALGHSFELCTEFTGLVSWTKGAAIHWHHDSNRPHLKQRVATAVVYLNDCTEFCGGQLQFQDGDLRHVSAAMGSMVTFMADAANVHRVTEVTAGERLTLTLWFTLQPEHSEDTAVLRQLSPDLKRRQPPGSLYRDCGIDIRTTRLAAAGLSWAPTVQARESFALNGSVGSEGSADQTDQPSPGRLQTPCSSSGCCCCKDDGVCFDSLQAALLALSWLQWHGPAAISEPTAAALCKPNAAALRDSEAAALCEQTAAALCNSNASTAVAEDNCGCMCVPLAAAKSGVGAYLKELKGQLPAAVGAWTQAGLLYNHDC